MKLSLVPILLLPMFAEAGELRVVVANGPSSDAKIYAALFDSAEGYAADKAFGAQTIAVRDGGAHLTFSGLAPGRYALKVFADENGNGKLDSNPLGLPIERYGFSNDARGNRAAPTFDAAAFSVDGDARITINLR